MRLLHTIKGSARMAGAMRFGQMIHDMETRVEEAIGLPEVPETLVDQLLAQYDQAFTTYEALKSPAQTASALAADAAASARAGSAPEAARLAAAAKAGASGCSVRRTRPTQHAGDTAAAGCGSALPATRPVAAAAGRGAGGGAACRARSPT